MVRQVNKGDRVEVTARMPNEPDPIPVGTRGTVEEAFPQLNQIWVDWDEQPDGTKRSLILLFTDPFKIVRE